MTRIIGGTAGGRRLQTPRGERTRPTSDRVREALFSAVESWAGSWEDLRVLDLYAGSGALGLESRSRGAARVTLVEHDRPTARLIVTNARTLGMDEVEVRAEKVRGALDRGPTAGEGGDGGEGGEGEHDLVLVDPPYPMGEEELARDLEALPGWLAPGALVVLERSSRSPEPRWPDGVSTLRSRRYGETTLWYGLAASPSPGAAQAADDDVAGAAR